MLSLSVASGQESFTIDTSIDEPESPATEAESPSAESTELAESESMAFTGTVASTTKYSFDIQTDVETIRCHFDDQTEFAIRLQSPWFDFKSQKVFVNGETQIDGTQARVGFDLPDGPLHLLTQFRSNAHLQRMKLTRPMRVNFYLLSPDYIEPSSPSPNNLMMSGTLSVSGDSNEQVLLEIGEESIPIQLGFKSATLRGRSINDLTIGKTKVMVTGAMKPDGSFLASTVLFQPF